MMKSSTLFETTPSAYLLLFVLPGKLSRDQPQSEKLDDTSLGKCMTITLWMII